MASFKLELADYVDMNGLQSVRIRIVVNRRIKRVNTGVKIHKKYWNNLTSEIRKSHPDFRQIDAAIRRKLVELNNLHLEHIINDRLITAESLQSAVENKAFSGKSFFKYMEHKISLLPSPASRKNQTSVLKKLRDFRNGKDLFFDDITPDFLARYKIYLEKVLGNSPNTVHFNIAKLKTAYEEAVSDGVYEYAKTSPFKRIKTQKTKSRRAKLSLEDIKALQELELPAGHLNHARNIFLFSFYLQGIRASDLLQLKWKQVDGDRLYYTANKTKKGRSRLIIGPANQILDQYRVLSGKQRPNDYIFPYLKTYNQKDYNEDSWLKVLDSKVSQIRTNLTKIAKMLDIPKLSLHVARHTFADIARKKTGNIYLVSDALDHGDLKTTENYFASAQNEENDDFVRHVFGL